MQAIFAIFPPLSIHPANANPMLITYKIKAHTSCYSNSLTQQPLIYASPKLAKPTATTEFAMDHHPKLAPNVTKAMEDKERTLQVPASDPDDDGSLPDLVGRQQPQLQRDEQQQQHQAPNISEMKPVTREAYGGGMYANEEGKREPGKPRASATQSADGPEEPVGRPRHPPPPSTGDRDLDITGMSYIQ
jgi:hypothetical protein